MLRLLSPYSAKMAAVSARHMATKVDLFVLIMLQQLFNSLALRSIYRTSLTLPEIAPVLATSNMLLWLKVSVANVKELRKLTALPMKLCREALQQGNDDVQTAMAWLDNNEEARAQ
jgi:ABC-type sugar transport system permease subunit